MELEELKSELESVKLRADQAWNDYTSKENEEKAKMKAAVQPFEDKWSKLHRVQSALETLIAHYSPETSEKTTNT